MVKGSVVLVPFPFDDLSAAKVRPAVCLTDPIGSHRHIVLAFISSRKPGRLEDSDLMLESTHPDFAVTGLRVSSVLRLHRLMTVSLGIVRRRLGALPAQWLDDVDNRIRTLFRLK